jgi:hypothetical protein
MVTFVSIHQMYSPGAIFRIYRTEGGRWRASTGDGLIAGTFFERAAAIRFAAREGDRARMQVLDDDRVSYAGRIGPGPTIAKC